MKYKTSRECLYCKKRFIIYICKLKWGNGNYCSHSCNARDNKPRYKGGVVVIQGYRKIRIGKSYFFEHRLMMEKKIGRKLKSGEYVHHLNHNRLDNSIENLAIVNNREHSRLHYVEWKDIYKNCQFIRKNGKQCKRFVFKKYSTYCYLHNSTALLASTSILLESKLTDTVIPHFRHPKASPKSSSR